MAGTFRGKEEVARFAAVGIQIFPDEVVATGLPWRTTVCVRGRDFLRDDSGAVVYENRYVIWGRMAWGRLKAYEVYEDTHKPDALDECLARSPPDLAVA